MQSLHQAACAQSRAALPGGALCTCVAPARLAPRLLLPPMLHSGSGVLLCGVHSPCPGGLAGAMVSLTSRLYHHRAL